MSRVKEISSSEVSLELRIYNDNLEFQILKTSRPYERIYYRPLYGFQWLLLSRGFVVFFIFNDWRAVCKLDFIFFLYIFILVDSLSSFNLFVLFFVFLNKFPSFLFKNSLRGKRGMLLLDLIKSTILLNLAIFNLLHLGGFWFWLRGENMSKPLKYIKDLVT